MGAAAGEGAAAPRRLLISRLRGATIATGREAIVSFRPVCRQPKGERDAGACNGARGEEDDAARACPL